MDKTKNTREMKSHVKALDDKQVEAGREKRPYATPELLRLGNVKELTQGGAPLAYDIMDEGSVS